MAILGMVIVRVLGIKWVPHLGAIYGVHIHGVHHHHDHLGMVIFRVLGIKWDHHVGHLEVRSAGGHPRGPLRPKVYAHLTPTCPRGWGDAWSQIQY